MDLKEGQPDRLVELPSELPILVVGGDKGAESDDPGVCKELGHLAHPPDVLLPVLRGKAEVLVQAGPHIVTIKAIGRDASGHQVLFQGK